MRCQTDRSVSAERARTTPRTRGSEPRPASSNAHSSSTSPYRSSGESWARAWADTVASMRRPGADAMSLGDATILTVKEGRFDYVDAVGEHLTGDRKIVSEGVNRAHEANDLGVLLITHYTRILRYIEPTHVHVFVNGQIVESGGKELADELEISGYDKYVKAVHA